MDYLYLLVKDSPYNFYVEPLLTQTKPKLFIPFISPFAPGEPALAHSRAPETISLLKLATAPKLFLVMNISYYLLRVAGACSVVMCVAIIHR